LSAQYDHEAMPLGRCRTRLDGNPHGIGPGTVEHCGGNAVLMNHGVGASPAPS